MRITKGSNGKGWLTTVSLTAEEKQKLKEICEPLVIRGTNIITEYHMLEGENYQWIENYPKSHSFSLPKEINFTPKFNGGPSPSAAYYFKAGTLEMEKIAHLKAVAPETITLYRFTLERASFPFYERKQGFIRFIEMCLSLPDLSSKLIDLLNKLLNRVIISEGCETIADLQEKGLEITVVEMSDYLEREILMIEIKSNSLT